MFLWAFKVTWRTRILQSLPTGLNFPKRKPNLGLTLTITPFSSNISKDHRTAKVSVVQVFLSSLASYMLSHIRGVGESGLASYICLKWMDHTRKNHYHGFAGTVGISASCSFSEARQSYLGTLSPPSAPIPHPLTSDNSWHSLLGHWDSGWDLLPYKGFVSFLFGIS